MGRASGQICVTRLGRLDHNNNRRVANKEMKNRKVVGLTRLEPDVILTPSGLGPLFADLRLQPTKRGIESQSNIITYYHRKRANHMSHI